jgi:formylglycine-generating enzyme required for sulfatase activity
MPNDLVEVADAPYAVLEGLGPGSAEAQERQLQATKQLGSPLEVRTRKAGIAFRLIPAGSFTMGSPQNEVNRGDDEAQHQVTLTKAFYCGKFELTQRRWDTVWGRSPSHLQSLAPDAPVKNVTWDDCQAFVNRLSEMEGVGEGTYRLLTESEWEYACRGGTCTAFCRGNDWQAFEPLFNPEHKGLIVPIAIGGSQPNAWGLYNMHGSVWEWCQDWYNRYPPGSVTDPLGPHSGVYRVCRGGDQSLVFSNCRSAQRFMSTPGNCDDRFGFRLARTIRSSS